MVIALWCEGRAHAFHGQADGHLAVAGVHQDMRFHSIFGKQFQGDASGILVGIEEDEVFFRKQP